MKKVFSAIFLVLLFFSAAFGGATWVRDNFYFHDSDQSGTTWYTMTVTRQGGWIIEAIDTTGTKRYRATYSYVSGDTDFQTAWDNRAVTGGASSYKVFPEAGF